MYTAPANALAAAAHPDPYPYYADLLAREPLAYDSGAGLWVAASAQAVHALLTHPYARVRPPAEPVPAGLAGTPVAAIFRLLVRMRDDPARRPLKDALAADLGSLDLCAVAERAAALAAGVGVAGAAGEPGWLAAFMLALPPIVVAHLLGVPAADLAATGERLRAFVACLRPGADAACLARGGAAAERLRAAIGAHLGAGALGLAASARHGADALVANAIGLLMQSYEATAGLIGNALVALAARPELCARLPQEAELLDAVLGETLRFDPPIQNTRRFLAADVELFGCRLRAGDGVLLVLAAANRDPAANPRPAAFDPLRAAPRSFTFGAGAHVCPGERLARTIAAAGVRSVLASGLDIGRLAGHTVYYQLPNARIPRFGGTTEGASI